MSNSYTVNINLAKPGDNDSGWGSVINSDLDYLAALAPIGALAVKVTENPSASLNIRVAAGKFCNAAGAAVTYAGTSSFALTASATNSVYLSDSGVLTKSTTGYPASTNLVRLATVVTGTTTISSVTDDRAAFASFGGSAGSGAPADGTYIVQTASSGLSAEQALGSLATGILKSTTATGVLSIAVAGTDYLTPSGSGASLTALNATQLTTGTVGTARLGTGTASSSTYLRGDGTWTAPAGSGDVVGPAASVDSEVALYSSTTGKLLKRASITGLAKLASGVLSAATAGTDYLGPSGSGASLTALNGTQITTGTVPTARLGTGTASSSTYLRGDQTWATISGTGDASTNTSSSVDSEVVLFSGTAGKTLKRASGTGLAKLTAGVLGTATLGTDYFGPGGDVTISGSGDLVFNTGTDIIVATSGAGTMIANVNFAKMAFWGSTPTTQPTAVADASDATSVITQLNALLAKLRTIGLIAT